MTLVKNAKYSLRFHVRIKKKKKDCAIKTVITFPVLFYMYLLDQGDIKRRKKMCGESDP